MDCAGGELHVAHLETDIYQAVARDGACIGIGLALFVSDGDILGASNGVDGDAVAVGGVERSRDVDIDCLSGASNWEVHGDRATVEGLVGVFNSQNDFFVIFAGRGKDNVARIGFDVIDVACTAEGNARGLNCYGVDGDGGVGAGHGLQVPRTFMA